MSRNAIIIVVLATLAASGCAHARTATSSVEPSAAVSDEMANLAGHWQGAVWEIGSSLVNGQAPLDLQLGPDGTWRGTVGKAQASGTARLHNGRLILSGTQQRPDRVRETVNYSLAGDATRRWGANSTTFSGRATHAQVSLQKVSS
jgi:hypothetical protein